MPGVLSAIRFLVKLMHKLSVANWALTGLQVRYYELYIAILSKDSYPNCYEKCWLGNIILQTLCVNICSFSNVIFEIPLFEPDHIFNSYGAGTGPIYLSQLNCDGSEATVLDCETFADATGIHKCDHIEDIGVHCQGDTNA